VKRQQKQKSQEVPVCSARLDDYGVAAWAETNGWEVWRSVSMRLSVGKDKLKECQGCGVPIRRASANYWERLYGK
jgi:hypothetical protein